MILLVGPNIFSKYLLNFYVVSCLIKCILKSGAN